MKFKSAYLKLTLFYVAIVMLISISFSLTIFEISKTEFNTGLRKHGMILRDMGGFPGIPDFERFRLDREKELNDNLKSKLIFFNLIILLGSAFASYLLAKRTLKPVEEMFELQNRFTADASHELRTPLTAMRTEIEVNLRDKNFNFDEAKKLLGSNLEEISRLEALSNSLLELSTYQNFVGTLRHLDIKDVLEEAMKTAEPLAKEKNIDLKNNLIGAKVLGDKRSLKNLFVILLDNAIKYSPSEKSIEVDMMVSGKYVEVKITDSGVGIKSTDLPHIFNRFFRASSSRSKDQVHGYGLGLSIAQKIVENHHGKIEVESALNKGTIFTVFIPLEKG